MADIDKWIAEEDALIEPLAEMLANSLSAHMDEAVSEFGKTGQFRAPGLSSVEQLVDILGNGWNSAVSLGTERQAALLTKQDHLTTRAVLEYVRTYGMSRTRLIAETTASQLNQMVITGQRRGLSNVEIAKSIINRIPQIAKVRGKIIAETEIHSATQFGSYNAALRSRATLKKTWNTVGDGLVRSFGHGSEFSHQRMQGVKSALDISFNVPHYTGTFEALRFSGDPEGSAGNIINCRCITTYEEA